MGPRIVALALAPLLALAPRPARSEPAPPTVLLMVAEDRRAELDDALRVELAGRGFAVEPASPPAGADEAERGEAARAAAAAAGARFAVWVDAPPAELGAEPSEPVARAVVRVTAREGGEVRHAELAEGYATMAERVFAVVAASLIDELTSPPASPMTAHVDVRVEPGTAAEVAEAPAEEAPAPDDVPPAAEPPAEAPRPQLLSVDFGFDVVPFVGWSMRYRGQDARRFSLGLLGGYSGGVRVLEAASLFNIERVFVQGAQLAGLFNLDLGWVRGGQAAGLFNYAAETVLGAQLAGAFNLTLGGAGGVQAAGVWNLACGPVVGAQLAGVFDIALGPVVGAQLAGVWNHAAGEVRGAQLAGVWNLATGSLRGAQLAGIWNAAQGGVGVQMGLVNVSRGDLRGWQVGLVNYAEASDVSLGLVNIVPGGRLHLDVWGTEAGFVYVGLKHGGRYLHNIFAAGLRVTDGSWSYGLGIGGHVPLLDWLALDLDLLVHSLEAGAPQARMNLLAQGRVVLAFRVISWLSIMAGLSYNVLVTVEPDGGAEYPLFGDSLLHDGGFTARGWPGFLVGLQLI